MDMTTLIAAAANAAGEAPSDSSYPAWKGRVLSIASDLASMVAGHEARENRKAVGTDPNDKVTAFFARLIKVEEIQKGQGENTVRKGKLTLEAFNSSNADQQGYETIETAPLGTPEGDEEFMRAQALVGQSVKIYKRNFLHPTDKSKKLKELIAVDPASGFAPATTVASAPAAPRPPAENATKDSERLGAVREQLNALEDADKNAFREFMQLRERPVRAADWSDEDLDLIEGWFFGGDDGAES